MVSVGYFSRRLMRLLLGMSVLLAVHSVVTEKAVASTWTSTVDRDATTVWAVGDGGRGEAARPVSELIASKPFDYLFYLGDVYQTGTPEEFLDYGFTEFADRTFPILGNHEYANRHEGYFPFWTGLRGSPPPRYYSFWLSGWQVLALDSEGRLGRQSDKYRWVRRETARYPGQERCRVILSHRPRWSAGLMQDSRRFPMAKLAPIQRLTASRVAAWISAHEHNMQRLNRSGTHQFISGAGGKSLHRLHPSKAKRKGLRWASTRTDGALRLRFSRSGKNRYLDWQFFSAPPSGVGSEGGGQPIELDSGRISCRVAWTSMPKP